MNIYSKNEVIRTEAELIRYFRELIEEEPELTWRIPKQPLPLVQITDIDFLLDNRTIRFRPVYALRPSEKEIEQLQEKDRHSSDDRLLLVVPDLKERILRFCRFRGLSAIDLNGRVYLRAPHLLVDRKALHGRDFRYELEPRNVFAGKSARIVRSILTDRTRDWTQGELVKRTQASGGLVSRIVQHLIAQGYAEKTSSRTFRLTDVSGLIEAWIKADDLRRRTTLTRLNVFGGTPIELAHKLQSWATSESVPIAFTQWIAGWLRHPYTEPVITSAYVSRLPDSAILDQLGLRPVSDGGKVWLYIPDDEGVFLETQNVDQLTLASDAQIVVDLEGTGLRGPDQASALRAWKGFCRP